MYHTVPNASSPSFTPASLLFSGLDTVKMESVFAADLTALSPVHRRAASNLPILNGLDERKKLTELGLIALIFRFD